MYYAVHVHPTTTYLKNYKSIKMARNSQEFNTKIAAAVIWHRDQGSKSENPMVFKENQLCILYVLYFTKGFQGIKNLPISKADTSKDHINDISC